MSTQYGPGSRALQDRFDTRRLADRLAEGASDQLGEPLAAFIEARDMFFIATTDDQGFPECSYKGGEPGFVRVLDPHTIAFPVFDGNGMFLTAGNLVGASPHVGLLFIDFESGSRLRVNGHATVDFDDALLSSYPGAIFVVRVAIRTTFVNCQRYVHHYARVDASPFVPDDRGDAPVPDWKRDPWFDGTLPAGDPALDPSAPTAPAMPQFP